MKRSCSMESVFGEIWVAGWFPRSEKEGLWQKEKRRLCGQRQDSR